MDSKSPHERRGLRALPPHGVRPGVRLRPHERARAGTEVFGAGRGRRVSVLHALRKGCQPRQPPKQSSICGFYDQTEETVGVLQDQAVTKAIVDRAALPAVAVWLVAVRPGRDPGRALVTPRIGRSRSTCIATKSRSAR